MIDFYLRTLHMTFPQEITLGERKLYVLSPSPRL